MQHRVQAAKYAKWQCSPFAQRIQTQEDTVRRALHVFEYSFCNNIRSN